MFFFCAPNSLERKVNFNRSQRATSCQFACCSSFSWDERFFTLLLKTDRRNARMSREKLRRVKCFFIVALDAAYLKLHSRCDKDEIESRGLFLLPLGNLSLGESFSSLLELNSSSGKSLLSSTPPRDFTDCIMINVERETKRLHLQIHHELDR